MVGEGACPTCKGPARQIPGTVKWESPFGPRERSEIQERLRQFRVGVRVRGSDVDLVKLEERLGDYGGLVQDVERSLTNPDGWDAQFEFLIRHDEPGSAAGYAARVVGNAVRELFARPPEAIHVACAKKEAANG